MGAGASANITGSRARTTEASPDGCNRKRAAHAVCRLELQAERRGLTMRADCPTYSQAFHDGCESYIEDQARPQSVTTPRRRTISWLTYNTGTSSSSTQSRLVP
jgi:hypothetical protein